MVYIKAAVVGILTGFLLTAVALVLVVTYEWLSFVNSQQDFGAYGDPQPDRRKGPGGCRVGEHTDA